MADTDLNTKPIWSRNPESGWGTVATANTAKDGTGTVVTVFEADASNGGRLDHLKVRALGTNVATVLRIFINNGATNATATNNSLYHEATIAASTLSETSALADYKIELKLVLKAGYKINVTIGTTVAAGLQVTGIGGDY